MTANELTETRREFMRAAFGLRPAGEYGPDSVGARLARAFVTDPCAIEPEPSAVTKALVLFLSIALPPPWLVAETVAVIQEWRALAARGEVELIGRPVWQLVAHKFPVSCVPISPEIAAALRVAAEYLPTRRSAAPKVAPGTVSLPALLVDRRSDESEAAFARRCGKMTREAAAREIHRRATSRTDPLALTAPRKRHIRWLAERLFSGAGIREMARTAKVAAPTVSVAVRDTAAALELTLPGD